MQSGSLAIEGMNANSCGVGASWTGNTAGLLLECLDNTEIAVHDEAHRVASSIHFREGSTTNKITIGRNMGWDTVITVSTVDINGTVNILNTLQVAENIINNYLFNNTGRNHATFTDCNAIDKFKTKNFEFIIRSSIYMYIYLSKF
jgi:hypothetical protein